MTIELIQAIVRQTTVLIEPLFMGQHFAADNIHADNAGGVIIGDAWWKAMQTNCIAQ